MPATRGGTLLSTAPVQFDMPDVAGVADLSNAMGAVLKATATGVLTPEEASSISQILDARRRAIETAELEQRIADLEAAPT